MDCSGFEGFRFWLNDTLGEEAVRGWVHGVNEEQFTVIANPGQRVVEGEEVACVVTNFGQEIRFVARVESQAFGVMLISASRRIRAAEAKEPGRKKTNEIQVLELQGSEREVRVVDISPGGLGIETDVPFTSGATGSVIFDLEAKGALRLAVRAVHSSQVAPGIYRTGLEIVEIGRIDDAKWRGYLVGGGVLVVPKSAPRSKFRSTSKRKRAA